MNYTPLTPAEFEASVAKEAAILRQNADGYARSLVRQAEFCKRWAAALREARESADA